MRRADAGAAGGRAGGRAVVDARGHARGTGVRPRPDLAVGHAARVLGRRAGVLGSVGGAGAVRDPQPPGRRRRRLRAGAGGGRAGIDRRRRGHGTPGHAQAADGCDVRLLHRLQLRDRLLRPRRVGLAGGARGRADRRVLRGRHRDLGDDDAEPGAERAAGPRVRDRLDGLDGARPAVVRAGRAAVRPDRSARDAGRRRPGVRRRAARASTSRSPACGTSTGRPRTRRPWAAGCGPAGLCDALSWGCRPRPPRRCRRGGMPASGGRRRRSAGP